VDFQFDIFQPEFYGTHGRGVMAKGGAEGEEFGHLSIHKLGGCFERTRLYFVELVFTPFCFGDLGLLICAGHR